MVRKVFVVSRSSDQLNIQGFLDLLLYKFSYLHHCIGSLFPFVMGRKVTSDEHSVDIAHLLLDVVEGAVEKFDRGIAFRTTVLWGLAGLSIREPVFGMAANGIVADD